MAPEVEAESPAQVVGALVACAKLAAEPARVAVALHEQVRAEVAAELLAQVV